MFEDSLAPRSDFDLNFRLGDIPVRVHPYFWLSTLLLGWSPDPQQDGREMILHLLVWAAIVFVSVLIHEMGHILMGRIFGSRGHIVLTGFCGLAIGSRDQYERWQRILVSLAGPGAGFLFAAVVAGLFSLFYPEATIALIGQLIRVRLPVPAGADIPSELVEFTMRNLLWINVFWGLVNLLPIWPLDGGQVCQEICESQRPRQGQRHALQISVFVAGGFAVLALIEVIHKGPLLPYLSLGGSFFSVLFFGLLAFNSWRLLQFVVRSGGQPREPQEPRARWERDPDWWKHGGDSGHD